MEKNLKYITNETRNNDESRFIDWDIKKIHDVLKCGCNIINEHLIQYYVFDVKNV